MSLVGLYFGTGGPLWPLHYGAGGQSPSGLHPCEVEDLMFGSLPGSLLTVPM